MYQMETFLLVERIWTINLWNRAFREESTKLGMWFLNIIRIILRNGATSDLTFGDLQTSKLTIYGINIQIIIS